MASTYSLDLESSSSQYAQIADASQTGLDFTTDLTLELWVKFESLPATGDQMNFITKYLTTGNQRGFRFFINDTAGTRTLQFQYTSDGSVTQTHVSSAITVTTGVWYYFAVVFTAASHESTFYQGAVNSVPVAVGTDSAGTFVIIFDNTASFKLGTSGSLDFFLDGLIDEVRAWNTPRTSDNIIANYQTEIGTNTNLKGYWKFNNDYSDSSGNGNTLTASGSPVFSTDVPNWPTGAMFLFNLL